MTPSTPYPPLTEVQQAAVEATSEVCRVLYDGVLTPHRSCGISLAETFGRPTRPYQALRRGGLTGRGECGALVAGRLILGEIFGDPDPSGSVTAELASAVAMYDALWPQRLRRGNAPGGDVACQTLTGQFATFKSAERHRFCTTLARDVASVVAEVLVRHGHPLPPPDSVLGESA